MHWWQPIVHRPHPVGESSVTRRTSRLITEIKIQGSNDNGSGIDLKETAQGRSLRANDPREWRPGLHRKPFSRQEMTDSRATKYTLYLNENKKKSP